MPKKSYWMTKVSDFTTKETRRACWWYALRVSFLRDNPPYENVDNFQN